MSDGAGGRHKACPGMAGILGQESVTHLQRDRRDLPGPGMPLLCRADCHLVISARATSPE